MWIHKIVSDELLHRWLNRGQRREVSPFPARNECWWQIVDVWLDSSVCVLFWLFSMRNKSGPRVIGHQWLLTLMQQLLSEGGLFALRLKESVNALPDQILPARSSRRSQSTCFYGDDLPWRGTPHTYEHTAYRCRSEHLAQLPHDAIGHHLPFKRPFGYNGGHVSPWSCGSQSNIPSHMINRRTFESLRYLWGPVLWWKTQCWKAECEVSDRRYRWGRSAGLSKHEHQ